MGHQINLFLLPEDLRDLEASLKSRWGVHFLAQASRSPTPRELATLCDFDRKDRFRPVFLVRSEDLEMVSLLHIPAQSMWVVDGLRSLVIEFSRPVLDGLTLHRGRLFVDQGYYDAQRVWIDKPASFQAWTIELLAMVKGMLQRDRERGQWVSERVAALLGAGRLELRSL